MNKEVTYNRKLNNTKEMTVEEQQQELLRLIGDDEVVGKAIVYDIPRNKTKSSFEEVIEKALNEEVNVLMFKSVESFVFGYNKPSMYNCISTIKDLRSKGIDIMFSNEEIHSIDPSNDMELGSLIREAFYKLNLEQNQ